MSEHLFDDMGYCTKCKKLDVDIIAELEAELLKTRELVSNNLYDGSERIAELETDDE